MLPGVAEIRKNCRKNRKHADHYNSLAWYSVCLPTPQIHRNGNEVVQRGNQVYKWNNHFSEMKGDVGMSRHEKEGEQEDAYTKTGNH